MNTQPLTLTAPDGHPTRLQFCWPDQPQGVLVISHGMAEHSGRYRELARWLAGQGLAVVTFDHRGHGAGIAPDRLGHYGDRQGWASVVGDLHRVVSATREHFPGLPVHLFGHSMGSFIAQAFAQRHGDDIDSLILSATNRIHRPELILSRLLVGVLAQVRGRRHRSPLMTRLTFGKFNRQFRPNRTTCDWLSRDTGQVDQYLADPLCGFDCSLGLWQDFIGGMLSIDPHLWRKDLPVHLFAGTDDPVGEMGTGVRRHFQTIRDAGIETVTLRLFDGGRHEMLNETNRNEVWQYLQSLCLSTTARQPAVAATG